MPHYVLTGAPGAGKTAVLRQLETLGYAVVEEAATDVIALEQARGTPGPWADPGFIDAVVTLQRQRFAAATGRRPATESVFFDRSPVCTLALRRYLGHPATPLLDEELERVVAMHQYSDTVFFIRSLGFVHHTAARRTSLEDSLTFERIHEEAYRDLGFRLVDVDAGPVARRTEQVLHGIEARGR